MNRQRVRIRLLGGLQVTVDDATVDVGPMRCQAVLATLALTPSESVTVTRLIHAIWADGPPRTADKTLQSYMSVLRRALEPHGVEIDRVGAAYVLRVDRAAVDLWRFEQHLARGDEAAALGEWTGEPLAGLDVPGLDSVITGLVARWQSAVEGHLERLVDGGRPGEAIGPLTELTAEHPYRENLWALLMRALYVGGRQADALQAFTNARRQLVDGLGVEPSDLLRDLEAAILRHDPALRPRSAPTMAAAAPTEEADRRTTMAFLFTDIEGSTRRWEQYPDAMMDVVARHDAAIERVVVDHGGEVFHRSGDGVIASFPNAPAAVMAAAQIQRRIAGLDWSAVGGLKVRAAVHVGHIVIRGGEPFGWALNFGSRLMSTGHGGQIVLSEATVDTVDGLLPDEFAVVSLGTTRLRDIARPTAVFQLRGPGLDTDFPPLRTKMGVRRIAPPATSTIGRDGEIDALVRDIRTHRLVNVVGPNGAGASRLALVAALEASELFTDGTVRTDLVGVDPARAVDAIATSLQVGARPRQGIERSLVDWLADQELLLLWDHCDRATAVLRPLIDALLREAPGITIVCTSGRSLGIEGERVHRIGPLGIEAAAALFRERAAAVGTAVPDDATLRALCERLDRIPLSIEVAAANSAVYTVQELNDLLDERDLLDVDQSPLVSGSMFDAITVAVGSLADELRAMLRSATVFAGPFDRSAFAQVCAPQATLLVAGSALRELVDRSLLQVEDGDGERYFRVLDSVAKVVNRVVDADRRADADDRFRAWVADFVRSAADGLRGPDEASWSRRIARQFPNIRVGFDRAITTADLATAATISTALWDYGFMRFNDEYFRWSVRVLDVFPSGDPSLLGPVHGAAAFGAWLRDELDLVVRWANRALELEREWNLAFDLTARLALVSAVTYSSAGRAEPTIVAELAEYQRARPELYFHVNVEVQNSIMATWLGRPSVAVENGVRAVRLARESQNPSSLAFALWALGSALEDDDPVQAETLLGTALETAREVGNDWVTALVQMWLAQMRRRTSSALDAVPILLDLLDLLVRAGHHSHLWTTLRTSALVLGDLGHDRLAVQLRAWVQDSRLAMPPLPIDAAAADEQYRRIVAANGADWVERSELLTRTWTLDSALALVRAELEACLADA